MICPFMSKPYIHKFENNGYMEEEERLNEVGCLMDECMAWNSFGKGTCKLIDKV